MFIVHAPQNLWVYEDCVFVSMTGANMQTAQDMASAHQWMDHVYVTRYSVKTYTVVVCVCVCVCVFVCVCVCVCMCM